jgi:hypothetical protein
MMETDFEHASLYIDLDALFDTRLATLFQIDPVQTEKIIAGDYFKRHYDEFEGIDTALFKERYQQRDIRTLKNAVLTSANRIVNQFIKDTLLALVNSPFRRQPRIVVNTYPYQLSEAEERVIMEGLIYMTHRKADIALIHESFETLTPEVVKSQYIQLVMYNYWDWLETHAVNKNWEKTACLENTLFGPQLVKSSEAALKLEGEPVFSAIESAVGCFIQLVLLPAQLFSADLERYAKHKT